MIACGLPHIGRGDHEQSRREMTAIQDQVAGLRRFGAASLDLAFVAAGRLDGYWERNLQSWDIAAGQIIVREPAAWFPGSTGPTIADDGPCRLRQRVRARRTGEDLAGGGVAASSLAARKSTARCDYRIGKSSVPPEQW